jgi:hypothetical protein
MKPDIPSLLVHVPENASKINENSCSHSVIDLTES